jgi:hypothetical protein
MTIPANQIIHAEIQMQGVAAPGGSNSVNIDNVYHYRRTTTVNPVTKAALEAAFQAGPVASILLALNARYTQSATTVRWIDDALDQALPFAEAGVGAVAGDPQSTIDAVYIKMRTGVKGRSYRGSKHYAPLSEADATIGDVLNAAAITRFGAIITALNTPLVDGNGNTWVLQVFSRTLSQTLINPTNIVANDVTSILLNKRIGRMKRRETKSVY